MDDYLPNPAALTSSIGRPAGFPACSRCPYLHAVEASACATCLTCCAGRRRSDRGRSCAVCDQLLARGERCANDWCERADRWFSAVWAVGPHAGRWRRVIAGYKYRAETGWAPVLARILVGFLDEHMPWFDDFDALLPMPAYTGPGARRPSDPTAELVAAAARLAGPRWDFGFGLVVKDGPTPALAGRSRPDRRVLAEDRLRRALRVPDPKAVAGRRLLVVDDVFTEGSTLREVARVLVQAGADEVAGLVLARQPWTTSPQSVRT